MKLKVARWPRATHVAERLDALLANTDAAERLRNDPLALPHRYTAPRDQEVAALLSASLAYGRVDLFKPRLTALLDALGPSPADAALLPPRELLERTRGFAYRMTDGRDVACLLHGAGQLLAEHGSLGAAFAQAYARSGEPTVRGALGTFIDALLSADFRPLGAGREPSRRLKHLLPHPARGSACKRPNLFLRWMIRGPDGVDLGLWRDVPASALVIPLDTHVHRIGRLIGLTRRTDLSWRTAEEITSHLRTLDAGDPVRFDFALSHLGISGACRARKHLSVCSSCALQPVCRYWS